MSTQVRPHNPDQGIYATTSDYVHALEVITPSRLLFVAGTMGLNADGSPGDGVTEQLRLIWSNIRRILAEADMTVDNIVRLTSFLSDRSFADANAAARIEALGGRPIPTTAIVVQMLDPNWLVEIEVIAAG